MEMLTTWLLDQNHEHNFIGPLNEQCNYLIKVQLLRMDNQIQTHNERET